ncbi:MAG: type II secretion system F family protein [Myxococcales bacterium]|nr:type II secretion system F family protein [Myxococcales bacterium]MCB9536891.1 type II secretion system F family protein [Myxococcales bacterium]
MDGSVLNIATGASALATAFCVVLAVRSVFRARALEAEEAERRKGSGDEAEPEEAAPAEGRWGALASLLRPKTTEEMSQLRLRLARAGLRSQEAIELFNVARAIALLVGLFLFFVMMVGLGPSALILGSLVLGLAFYGPTLWLRVRTNARQEALQRSLPATLDLLVTCMEAGLGLEQAVARVAEEIDFSDPEMSEELSVVIGEMRAGLTTASAFKKLSDRVTSDEVRNLTNVIIQSATLGAALGRTLREYASSARRKRELALEELAGKVTAGLTLPLTLCLLPSAVIAMLGPAVVIVINSLFE